MKSTTTGVALILTTTDPAVVEKFQQALRPHMVQTTGNETHLNFNGVDTCDVVNGIILVCQEGGLTLGDLKKWNGVIVPTRSTEEE